MITELVIDHQNFKQNRVAYGISLSEIVAIRDEKYTFENGEYFYEYSVVKRVKIKISKEKFLRDISKKEDK